jgi:hypothetical protein
MTARAGLLAALVTIGTVACTVRIAELSLVAAHRLDDGVRLARSGRAHVGRSCRWWVLGVPLGLPQIDEALAAALAPEGVVLRDVVLTSDHAMYGVVGTHCYTVRGIAVGLDPGTASDTE